MSKNRKKHGKEETKPSKHFTAINNGIQDAIDTFESKKKLTFDKAKSTDDHA